MTRHERFDKFLDKYTSLIVGICIAMLIIYSYVSGEKIRGLVNGAIDLLLGGSILIVSWMLASWKDIIHPLLIGFGIIVVLNNIKSTVENAIQQTIKNEIKQTITSREFAQFIKDTINKTLDERRENR